MEKIILQLIKERVVFHLRHISQMNLKKKIRNFKHSDWWLGRAFYQSLNFFWSLIKLVANGAYRAEYFAAIKFGSSYYQRSVFTMTDRYPIIFAACKKYLSTCDSPKILSFGCATGEEVFTLGKYMPGARILGVDMNTWCISQCNKRNANANFSFAHRFSQTFAAAGNFDAIFCMAVFQQTERRTGDNNKAHSLTFEQFEKELALLDDKLKPGGLLVIDNADFSFTDTVSSRHYKPLDIENNQLTRDRPLFDKNGDRISDTQNNSRIFIKSSV